MSLSSSVLIIGASRGLGLALTQHYAKLIGPKSVYATIRGDATDDKAAGSLPQGVNVVGGIDMGKESVGRDLVAGLQGSGDAKVDVVFVVAGLLKTEEFGKSSWKDQIDMYTVCAIAPVIAVEALVTNNLLAPNAKIILISSEAGSLTLRTPKEGGGNYGHHGSKAAANMAGRLLSFDLQEKGMVVAMVHPGFLKTEMTKSAGFEQHYEEMGAVSPEDAAGYLSDFVKSLDMSMSGKLWAPTLDKIQDVADTTVGGRGIGNVEEVMGNNAATQASPLELPW